MWAEAFSSSFPQLCRELTLPCSHRYVATQRGGYHVKIIYAASIPWQGKEPCSEELLGLQPLLRPVNFFCQQGARSACSKDRGDLFERDGGPLCSLFHSLIFALHERGDKLRTYILGTWQPQHKRELKVHQSREAQTGWAKSAGDKRSEGPA